MKFLLMVAEPSATLKDAPTEKMLEVSAVPSAETLGPRIAPNEESLMVVADLLVEIVK